MASEIDKWRLAAGGYKITANIYNLGRKCKEMRLQKDE